MAFGSGYDDDTEMSEINMTPLVDVMLVLLIIFMITVPVLTQSLKVDLPQTAPVQVQTPPETVTVLIDAAGALFWNEAPVSREELAGHLAAAARAQPQPLIQLQGDRHVDYEHVIRVMAQARQAGIEALGFVTEPGY